MVRFYWELEEKLLRGLIVIFHSFILQSVIAYKNFSMVILNPRCETHIKTINVLLPSRLHCTLRTQEKKTTKIYYRR